jgi:hypothetical protein
MRGCSVVRRRAHARVSVRPPRHHTGCCCERVVRCAGRLWSTPTLLLARAPHEHWCSSCPCCLLLAALHMQPLACLTFKHFGGDAAHGDVGAGVSSEGGWLRARCGGVQPACPARACVCAAAAAAARAHARMREPISLLRTHPHASRAARPDLPFHACCWVHHATALPMPLPVPALLPPRA